VLCKTGFPANAQLSFQHSHAKTRLSMRYHFERSLKAAMTRVVSCAILQRISDIATAMVNTIPEVPDDSSTKQQTLQI
jgi:hypothetical protein